MTTVPGLTVHAVGPNSTDVAPGDDPPITLWRSEIRKALRRIQAESYDDVAVISGVALDESELIDLIQRMDAAQRDLDALKAAEDDDPLIPLDPQSCERCRAKGSLCSDHLALAHERDDYEGRPAS